MKKFLIAAAALAGTVPAVAGAPLVSTDALREWNLIVLGDLTSSSEVEGRTFVGGNLSGNSSNYMIRQPSNASSTPGLTVVGDVTGGAKNLNNGSGAVIGGNVPSGFNLNGDAQTVRVGGTIDRTNVNNNTVESGLATSDPDFSAGLTQQKNLLEGSLNSLSRNLGDLDSNSDLVISGDRGTFNAAPDSDGVAVFNISSDQLDSIGEIDFKLNGADTAVVNVSGTDIRLNDNFLGGTNNLGEHVIWNFEDAEKLDLTTAWGGSVLAPKASATTGNYIQGSAVFGELVQNGEMHVGTYAGGYYPPSDPGDGGGSTDVPAPDALWLLILGLAGFGTIQYLRKRRQSTVS